MLLLVREVVIRTLTGSSPFWRRSEYVGFLAHVGLLISALGRFFSSGTVSKPQLPSLWLLFLLWATATVFQPLGALADADPAAAVSVAEGLI
jgi:hypothetical protein